jgi:hypothetical protein
MPIVKIVPMPGPQGPGGSGEGGDTADFVFDIVDEGDTSRITVANHDMVIRTTRDDNQDADITLDSADDIFITANGDDVHIDAADDVEITTNINGDGNSYTWEFTNSGELSFPDGTIQTTAYVPEETNIIPLPQFLTYIEGRSHLPVLNQNFGWDSDGVYFGPTADGGGEEESYPVFTNFTIPQNTPVIVEFDVFIEEFCSDAGIALFVDGTVPVWRWDPDPTRIAAQFDCPQPFIYGITEVGIANESSVEVPGPGIYRFVFSYNPNAETDKIVFGYLAGEELLALVSLNEALPEGDYRIGFASDNDRDEEDEGIDVTNRTYIKNLTIIVDPETENEVVYSDSLTNGNSGAPLFNTGDITFDGVKIIGAGDASGDGNGYGTMELVPDASRYESDQYLIIDPTEPNHIHIRAGGEQDNSGADLILGAERTNVRISDYGSVNVSTKRSSVINSYQNFNDASTIAFVTNDINADIGYGYLVNVDGTDYEVSDIQDNTPFEGSKTIQASGAVFTAGQTYTFSYSGGENYWQFQNDGTLAGPSMGNLIVYGITNPSEGYPLNVYSQDSLLLSGQNGEFLTDPSIPENQIATIGDLGVDTEFQVAGGTLGTQPTFDGDPLFTGSYVKTGPMVHFRIDVDFDNITNFGTGQYYVDLPIPSKYNYKLRAGCLHDIGGEDQFAISGHVEAGEQRLYLFWTNNNGQDEPFTSTAPVTLQTNDNFHVSGDYIALIGG